MKEKLSLIFPPNLLSALLMFCGIFISGQNDPYIQTSSGLGQYGYLEKSAVTTMSLNSNAQSNINQLFARTLLNGKDFLTYGNAVNDCSPSSGIVQNTNNYNFGADAQPGLIASTSVHVDYCGQTNSYGDNPNHTGYNERQHVIFGVSDRPSDLGTKVFAVSGTKNVVMSLKIDFGSDGSRFLKRFWLQNSGSLLEGTEIANDGFKLYYEAATGSETFSGTESSATLYGDYNANPTTNNIYGHDALNIPIPAGGLRIYVVLDSFKNVIPAGRTVQISLLNDGLSFAPKMDTNFDLARVNPVPAAPTSLSVCAPSSEVSTWYINNVKFLGTLNPDTTNPTAYSSNGYVDYSGNIDKAKQIPGGVINTNVAVTGGTGAIRAWVDWNRDGSFSDPGEKVYDTGAISASNVIFGFQIPAGTSPGIYSIRIRSSKTATFGPCESLPNGETEDYTFAVISDCSAVISSVSAATQCGAGPVLLGATASSGTTSYRWYDSEFSATLLGDSGNSYTAPSLAVGTTTYYVTAFNGSCESTYRTPIRVTVSPTPTIQFTQSAPEICGDATSITITSSGDQEEVTLLSENFDNSATLQFTSSIASNADPAAVWTVLNSPYIPAAGTHVINPAVYSGYQGGKFGYIMCDTRRNSDLLNYFTLNNSLNSTGFRGLKLDFDLYYFSEEDVEARNNLKVQYSVDGGTTWNTVVSYFTDQGIPSRFKKISLNLPAACENQTQLKFRFALYAFGAANEWLGDIAAIDNVRVYGNKALPTNFTWAGDNGILFDGTTCNTAPPAGGSPSVCIKPTDLDIENKAQFTVTATATLSNGCTAQGTLIIPNNSKIWNAAGATDWGTTTWKPVNTLPDITKCVVIKTPVNILSSNKFEAKNVRVMPAGTLNINKDSSLKVQNSFNNLAAPAAVTVESDGGLIQVNDAAVNSGTITAKRDITLTTDRQQYNYVISPLEGQLLKTVYPGINYVLYHNEANNYFYSSSGAYIKGRGLAVKEPNTTGVAPNATTATAVFTGYATNGAFTYSIVNSAPAATTPANTVRGYNLIGNPYPSNMDLNAFYSLNGGASGTLSSTFYFWDSTVNTIYVQQGSNYGGQSYGIFNAASPPGIGTGAAATGDISASVPKKPTSTVKMGQAFMARSQTATTVLQFNNSIRTTDTDGKSYFGKESSSKPSVDRYWLRLTTPSHISATCAVVYFAGGQDGFGRDDSFSIGGSDAIYSVVDHQQVAINGRSSFRNTDAVELGTDQFAKGNYRISLEDREGIFAVGQAIYLKDRKTGVITNLSEGDYVFDANAGQTVNRFEIVYLPETVLATDSETKETLQVYRDGTDFIIQSFHQRITGLEVFDASGRMIYETHPNTTYTVIPSERLLNGMYLLKIHQAETVTVKKIIQ